MAKKLEIQIVDDKTPNLTENVKSITEFELNAEIVAGSLTTNAKELKKQIENQLVNYTVEKYIGNSDAAKTDKAVLNKVQKAIADKRKEITKAWNKPLDDFLDEMKSLEKTISDASSKLNTIVLEADKKLEDEKRAQIEGYYKTLDTIVPLERIFNPKWLNKTYKLDKIMLDIEAITEKISNELATLNNIKDDDSEILRSFYLETLDLNATIQKNNQLKANRELLRKQDEQWKNEKLQEAGIVDTPKVEPQKPVENTVKPAESPSLMTFTLELTGTKEQLKMLRNFIDINGIKYRKVDYK